MILSLGSVNILVWSIWNINERRPFTPKWYLPKQSKAFSEIVLAFKIPSCRAKRWRRRHAIFVDMKKQLWPKNTKHLHESKRSLPGKSNLNREHYHFMFFAFRNRQRTTNFYKSATSSTIWFGARRSMHWNCRFCYKFWFETSTKHLMKTAQWKHCRATSFGDTATWWFHLLPWFRVSRKMRYELFVALDAEPSTHNVLHVNFVLSGNIVVVLLLACLDARRPCFYWW